MITEAIDKVLDSEFKDQDGTRTLREFLADCLIKLFEDGEDFSGSCAASDSSWYYAACECLLPLDGRIGHYEDFSDEEKEFILDDYKAANKALAKAVNRAMGTSRKSV